MYALLGQMSKAQCNSPSVRLCRCACLRGPWPLKSLVALKAPEVCSYKDDFACNTTKHLVANNIMMVQLVACTPQQCRTLLYTQQLLPSFNDWPALPPGL